MRCPPRHRVLVGAVGNLLLDETGLFIPCCWLYKDLQGFVGVARETAHDVEQPLAFTLKIPPPPKIINVL